MEIDWQHKLKTCSTFVKQKHLNTWRLKRRNTCWAPGSNVTHCVLYMISSAVSTCHWGKLKHKAETPLRNSCTSSIKCYMTHVLYGDKMICRAHVSLWVEPRWLLESTSVRVLFGVVESRSYYWIYIGFISYSGWWSLYFVVSLGLSRGFPVCVLNTNVSTDTSLPYWIVCSIMIHQLETINRLFFFLGLFRLNSSCMCAHVQAFPQKGVCNVQAHMWACTDVHPCVHMGSSGVRGCGWRLEGFRAADCEWVTHPAWILTRPTAVQRKTDPAGR